MAELRRQGAEHVTLLGNSGGASLLALAETAARADGRRLGDAIVALAATRRGRVHAQVIDPSVTDEADPLSVDPALDMFHPANGCGPGRGRRPTSPTGWPGTAPPQDDRIALPGHDRPRAPDRSGRGPQPLRRPRIGHLGLERRPASGRPRPHLTIYRTLADPAHLDPTIDRRSAPRFDLRRRRSARRQHGYGGLARDPDRPGPAVDVVPQTHSRVTSPPGCVRSTCRPSASTRPPTPRSGCARPEAGGTPLLPRTSPTRRSPATLTTSTGTDRPPWTRGVLAPSARPGRGHGPLAAPPATGPARFSRRQILTGAGGVGLAAGVVAALTTGFPGWVAFGPLIGIGVGDLLAGWRS